LYCKAPDRGRRGRIARSEVNDRRFDGASGERHPFRSAISLPWPAINSDWQVSMRSEPCMSILRRRPSGY
jgi:hypothetical protein